MTERASIVGAMVVVVSELIKLVLVNTRLLDIYFNEKRYITS